MEQIEITKNDADQRLDKFLLKTFPLLSKSMMYKAIRNKKIKVNRKRCTFDQKLNEEDVVLLFLPPDVLERKQDIAFVSTDLNIVYEDENILIVNKPYGLLSQSDTSEVQDCLVSRVQGYLIESGQFDPRQEHSFMPTICHRLDRNTTGLVIAAKNANALRVVNAAIKDRKIHKYYRAIVSNVLEKDLHMSMYLKKSGTKAVVSKEKKPGYVLASMDVRVLERNREQSVCEIELFTGRFHQIRALMASIGHPLVGDVKYGYRGKKKRYSLVAYRLVFEDIGLPIKQNIFEI